MRGPAAATSRCLRMVALLTSLGSHISPDCTSVSQCVTVDRAADSSISSGLKDWGPTGHIISQMGLKKSSREFPRDLLACGACTFGDGCMIWSGYEVG